MFLLLFILLSFSLLLFIPFCPMQEWFLQNEFPFGFWALMHWLSTTEYWRVYDYLILKLATVNYRMFLSIAAAYLRFIWAENENSLIVWRWSVGIFSQVPNWCSLPPCHSACIAPVTSCGGYNVMQSVGVDLCAHFTLGNVRDAMVGRRC